MTTSFSSLPVLDLAPLSKSDGLPATEEELLKLSQELHEIFKTTGFAYLINAPVSHEHDEILNTARQFFAMPVEEKMNLGKKTFRASNENTYRGYFPIQPSSNNLKEGFEIGPTPAPPTSANRLAHTEELFNLAEPNVWPQPDSRYFPDSCKNFCESLHSQLQALSMTLLSLLATSLNKPATTFTSLLRDSVSTLRLLNYPSSGPQEGHGTEDESSEITCSPHTDSGLLTLLFQDRVGGLEVLNAEGVWIPAPFVQDSIVVNIGDLMAKMSDGVFVATFHRVRDLSRRLSKDFESPTEIDHVLDGRISVPFFCEPGLDAMVPATDPIALGSNTTGSKERLVRYEEFVLGKMKGFIEFNPEVTNDELLKYDQKHGQSSTLVEVAEGRA